MLDGCAVSLMDAASYEVSEKFSLSGIGRLRESGVLDRQNVNGACQNGIQGVREDSDRQFRGWMAGIHD